MIRIFTRDFQFVTEIDAYESLIWTRRWTKQGEFQIVVNQHMENVDELLEGRLVSAGSNKTGIIAHIEELTSESGKGSDQLLIKGYDLKALLGKRVTMPPEGLAYDALTASAETIMKGYVDRNAVTTSLNRVIPDLTIKPDKSRGISFFYQTRFKGLAEELEKMSMASGIGWDVFFNGDGYIFDVEEGKDLTTLQNTNPPVIFSAEFDNVREQKMIESSLDYRNVAIVAGQGEGAEREVVLVGEASGMERNEVFIDARDIEDGGNLPDRGAQKLSEYARVESFETSVLTYGPFIFGEDWDLGDIVTVQNGKKTRTAHVRVSEVVEVIEKDGYRLDVNFGQPMPTLIAKIKRELDEPIAEGGTAGEPGIPGSDGKPGGQGPKGDTGAQGEKGATGERGPVGLTGPKGEAGAKGDTGSVGATGTKGDQGIQGLIGPTGAVGPQGSKGDVGTKGDAGAIGATGLQGPKGDVGPQGNIGPIGPKGDTGNQGEMGPPGSSQSYVLFEKEFISTNNQTSFSWVDGFNFPVGIRAVDLFVSGNRQPLTSFTEHSNGKGITLIQPISSGEYVLISAQMAVVDIQGPQGEKGDTGSTGALGLTGATGVKGDTGLQGIQGIQGPSGTKGDKGDTGATGLTGLKGDTGIQGIQGIQGLQGIQGVKGVDAKTWYSSTVVPATSLGVIGDFHINTATWDIREKTAATVWTLRGSIKGQQGIQGIQGFQGVKGDIGLTGAKGDTGLTGLTGAKGDKGDVGATGTVGVTGMTGAKGDKGDQGIPGAAVADSVEWSKVLNKPTNLETTTGTQTKIDQYKPYHAGTEAPTNKNLIWIDTN